MDTPRVGAVVLVRFPFSDLSNSKLRPAVVLADAKRGDWVLCQITSKSYADSNAIEISDTDFVSGGLLKTSYARAGKLFTANVGIITKEAGELSKSKIDEILKNVASLFRPEDSDQEM